jgi:hypothetical protein
VDWLDCANINPTDSSPKLSNFIVFPSACSSAIHLPSGAGRLASCSGVSPYPPIPPAFARKWWELYS